jgi:hypothetical protein
MARSGAARAVAGALGEPFVARTAASTDMSTARAFVRALPDVEVGLFRDTYDSAAHERFLGDAVAIGARAVSAHQDAVTAEFITVARDRGLAVYCGYQSLEVQAARLAEVAAAGLAGVVTDWPAQARVVLSGA